MPCPECGASVAVATRADHVCSPDRRLEFELFHLRAEISSLGAEIEEYLSSTQGRFEQWYADRERSKTDTDEPSGDPEG